MDTHNNTDGDMPLRANRLTWLREPFSWQRVLGSLLQLCSLRWARIAAVEVQPAASGKNTAAATLRHPLPAALTRALTQGQSLSEFAPSPLNIALDVVESGAGALRTHRNGPEPVLPRADSAHPQLRVESGTSTLVDAAQFVQLS